MEPIGCVHADRAAPGGDFWGGTKAIITLSDAMDEEALAGLEAFSHVEIVYVFDRVPLDKIVTGTRHPWNNTAWPRVGILAQRGKNRPNRIGVTIARIVSVAPRELHVAELDAIEGTPVLDIKPVMREFLPRSPVSQPAWATELMKEYWETR